MMAVCVQVNKKKTDKTFCYHSIYLLASYVNGSAVKMTIASLLLIT